jgi:precorrin-3B synthase
MPDQHTAHRSRRDMCPGVLRPWPAADGALVRLRLVGGRIPGASLTALVQVARTYGDGQVHLTGRANLQLRGLPCGADGLARDVVDAIEATGLLPSRSHELVRNVMVSPMTGLAGGRADLRPVAERLDIELCADADMAALPGRFLFVLDDGRGDLAGRSTDLGLMALDESTGQLRIGSDKWGATVKLADASSAMTGLAGDFLRLRGTGPTAPWHVDELPYPLVAPQARDPRSRVSSAALPYGDVGAGHHHEVPDGRLSPVLAARLIELSGCGDLVVTPWHGVLVPMSEVAR